MKENKTLLFVVRFSCAFAFLVIILGAYTRLSDAGLGCPDWPGCYGKMIVSDNSEYLNEANEAFPDRPLEQDKAWKEMVHRYVAGTLGILILFVAIYSWIKPFPSNIRFISSALLILVIFQALLGMWTVTLLLKPLVVVMHLLGGMTIISLLFWLSLRLQSLQNPMPMKNNQGLLPWVMAGIIVLVTQISLGGWTSSNYAALACPDFPTCQGSVWPKTDFKEAFILWRGLGVDYEGGVLDGPARTAIHMTHRIGAVITFLLLLFLAFKVINQSDENIRKSGIIMLILLLGQVSLGIANVVMHLPLYIAVAHNGVAALLLLSLVLLMHQSINKKI